VIQLIFFLTIGVLLFSSLFFLARRKARPEGTSDALVEARQALSSLQAGLLPEKLVKRVFDRGDWEYVKSEAPKPVRQLFLEERKRIAILWIDQVRNQINNLSRFHRGSARHYAKLNPRTEMSLAFSFFGLVCSCRALQMTVAVAGPYAAPRLVGAVATAAERTCKISEQSLAFLNAAQLGMLTNRAAGSALSRG
jgi:hypothetical protein